MNFYFGHILYLYYIHFRLTDRDKLILGKSFAAFEMQKYVASREWMGLTNEVRLLRSRANVNFRAGEICERRRLAVIKDDEERELRRARRLLLESKQAKADNAVQDADTEPEDNVWKCRVVFQTLVGV